MSEDPAEDQLTNHIQQFRKEKQELLARNADTIEKDSAAFLKQLPQMEEERRNRKPSNVIQVAFRRHLMAVAAVIVAIPLIWFFAFNRNQGTAPTGVQFMARADGVVERGFGNSLPKGLNVNFKLKTIVVVAEGDKLEGILAADPATSTAEEAVFNVEMSGIDRDGIRGNFKGRMRIVRNSPNAPVEVKANIQRIILDGDFVVGAQSAQPTSRAYYP